MNYLQKRKDPKTGLEFDNWQLCLPVPKAIQHRTFVDPSCGKALAGKNGAKLRIYRKSLGTSDRKAAERLARPLVNNLQSQFDAMLNAAGNLDIAQIATAAVYEPVKQRLNAALQNIPFGQEADEIAKRQAEIHKLSRRAISGDTAVIEDLVDRVISSQGIVIGKHSEEYQQFVDIAFKTVIDVLQVHVSQLQGDFDAQPRSKVVRDALKGKSSKASSGETIIELFDQYAQIRVEEGRKRANGIAQDRMVLRQFSEFVGPSRAISTITVNDARSFRDILRKVPTGYSKKKDYAGLTIRQAVEKAERDGAKRLSPKTRGRYMSTISPFFDWLRSEGRIDYQPFDGLHQKTVKGDNPLPPFSTDQLNQILTSPLFVGFERNGREHQSGNVQSDDWRYWIPLIGLFTGARVTEIAQLNVDDVVKHLVSSGDASSGPNDRYFFEFKEDPRTGQQIKSKQQRNVPVHSKLVLLGFINFYTKQVTRANRNGNRQLFPELTIKGADGKFGDVPSRFWRDYLEAINVKSGSDGSGFHSFRHTIADRLRKAGFMDKEFGPIILGHSDKSVTTGYGVTTQGTDRMRVDMLESVTFDDLDFSKLHTVRAMAQAFAE